MLVSISFMLVWMTSVGANHFNGGTISWAPAIRNTTSSSVMITITQSYSWMYPTISCQTNVPTSTNWILYPAVNLACIGNCSNQGGYSSNPISILTDCTSYSASLGILTSQRSVNVTFNESTYFWIAYQGISWRSLANAATSSNPGWSIVSLINLRRRPDGLFNTPPVSHITSPQYVIVNRTATITIPVTDVDIGDDLRCRWSLKNSPSGVDECDDICTSASIISLVNLTGCTLTFTATTSNDWYALALQVEDFFNTTSTEPMSSVAIQFLIYVLPTPTCSQAPAILPLTSCLEVQANVPMNVTLYAMNYCNRTRVIVTDILSTVTINGMSAGNLTNSTTNTSLVSVTFTWIPQQNQIGFQQFCAIAYTSESVQSNPYCVTFIVETSPTCITTTSTSTTTTTTSTASTTTTTSTISTTTTTKTTSTTATTSTTSSATTATTTSATTITTTTDTTTTTPKPNQSYLLLAIILPIIAVLLILGTIGIVVYVKKGRGTSKAYQLNKRRKDLKQDTFLSPTEEITTRVGRSARTNGDISSSKFNTQSSLHSFASNQSKASGANEQRVDDIDDNERTSGVHQAQAPSGRVVSSENHPRSAQCSTTVHQTNEMLSPSITKVHMLRLPRNKVSASFETGANPHRINEVPSVDINQKTTAKTISVYVKESGSTSRTNTVKPTQPMRRRASSFDDVTVTRVKTARPVNRSFRDPSVKVIRSNHAR